MNMMSAVHSLENLEIYQESLRLVKETYELCNSIQLKREYSLIDQMKRASISVSANLAEGYGRYTKKDFAQFLSISLGSCNEMFALLDVCKIIHSELQTDDVRMKYQVLSKRIYSFRKYLLSSR